MLMGNKLKRVAKQAISPIEDDAIEWSSVNVRLDSVVFGPNYTNFIDLSERETIEDYFTEIEITDEHFTILPRAFLKMRTLETFTMPSDIAAMFTLRSFAAQAGLEQSTSVWLKPGWTGQLILELTNFQNFPLLVKPGMSIGQVCFFQGDFE